SPVSSPSPYTSLFRSLGTNAHAVVLKYGVFDRWEEAAEVAKETKGVDGVSPFILQEVMITADNNLTGALLKGIDPATAGEVTERSEEHTSERQSRENL